MNLGDTAGVVINVAVMILSVLFGIGILLLGIWLITRYKRFSQYIVEIWITDDQGRVIEQRKDQAGIFVDRKSQRKLFNLKKIKAGLNCDRIPYIWCGKKKKVTLLQTAQKSFRFVEPHIDKDKLRFQVGEEDVNWAINEYEEYKRKFKSDQLMVFLGYGFLALVSVVILVLFVYFFKNFGVLKEIAVALKEAAVAIQQANAGTVIVQ